MNNNPKALFITNPHDLNSQISGGVQICSQYFLNILKIKFEIQVFEVQISTNPLHRLYRKLRIDGYKLYNPTQYLATLEHLVENEGIKTIFFNKSELIRFCEPLKKRFGERIKLVILSHGNETGDFLHDIVLGKLGRGGPSKVVELYRLGLNLYTESLYRRYYVDLVCSMSETEAHIERWLSAKKTFIIPQIISNEEPVQWQKKLGIVGFVGTLNHTPNYEALKEILQTLKNLNVSNVTLEIVGGPENIGQDLAKEFSQARYLGRLNDEELKNRISGWSLFLNPIFWYSRGASMKLSKAIAYEIPLVTTEAGRRGYFWNEGKVIETANNPYDFVQQILKYCNNEFELSLIQQEVRKAKNSSPTASEIANSLANTIKLL
ncbi:glycosyltransferase [Desertivirga brevis]|uniref:glycosyltransferase n=1 Tax=Desertivirga brevis TaxID=2810310 RepID=UPI001A963902|nr:glycosyltransferase [Pedobacter sp. SYSU D00873]